ncbi:hypothetical protein [Nocardiopsis sp. JB363]|uniref:hypothetical protein n=1 Tax=Nocardiopsis sp. JB363 TaxID=1434837 RepID=UPI00097A0EA4|nr:hypothetical protein [Nocardiopsis sp. JB363]SIO84917.1 hypothetical protein BQ8420_04325 [Nocardiopsis sp. JB363]
MSRASRPGHPRPTAVIVIAPDERNAEIVIEGRRQVVQGQAPKETRRAALDVATGYAAHIGQPVLVEARDANGFWRLIATPDGVVQAADQPVQAQPPQETPSRPPTGPVPAMAPTTPKGRADGAKRRRVLLIVGAACLALLLLAGGGLVAARFLSGSTAASEEGGDDTVVELGHPAPPGYAATVDITEELAPDTLPAVDREGERLVYIDPAERLNLLNAEGSREWSVDLPFEAGKALGSPRFVEFDGATHIALETPGALWFWPEGGGTAVNVELNESASAQFVGDGVLVRDDDDAYVLVDGELAEVDTPGGSAALLAEDGRALAGVLQGPWHWVAPGEDPQRVEPEQPDGAGDLDEVMTFLRGYALVHWETEDGDGHLLAFHDNSDGSVLGTAEVEEEDLAEVQHRTGPLGPDLAAYGPVLFAPGSGGTNVVPGFEPEVTLGDQVFGELDGAPVAIDASGEPTDVPEGAETPRGLLGDRAVVVHEGHLYAIPPE